MQSRIKEATLHVHVRESTDNGSQVFDSEALASVTVQVTRVWRTSHNGWESTFPTTATAAVSEGNRRAGVWLRIDVTNIITEWLNLPRIGLGLVVKAYDAHRKKHNLIVLNDNINMMPYLEVIIDDDFRKRTKRTVSLTCTEDSQENRCCRYPLAVDFEDFGWDWVIAPKRYEANFCMGDCPYAFMQKFPNTHMVHLASPPGYSGPCCTPTKVSSIQLLYFDHELNIIVGDIPGMIVERCGCS